MTDNKIIKALECCLSDNPPCYRCKYDADTITVDECMGKLMKDALDLINRQKAEIERLKSPAEMQIEVSEEIEKSIKSEGIKKFAERLCEDWRKDEDEMLCDVDIVK